MASLAETTAALPDAHRDRDDRYRRLLRRQLGSTGLSLLVHQAAMFLVALLLMVAVFVGLVATTPSAAASPAESTASAYRRQLGAGLKNLRRRAAQQPYPLRPPPVPHAYPKMMQPRLPPPSMTVVPPLPTKVSPPPAPTAAAAAPALPTAVAASIPSAPPPSAPPLPAFALGGGGGRRRL